MIVKQAINQGVKACEEAGVYSGFARFLMLELLRENDLDMYSLIDEELEEAIYIKYLEGMKRICNQEPMGYVLGYEWFYGYKIHVNEDVLIPRQETEELVGEILSYIDDYFDKPTIADVACGSGAIGIALSKELNTHVAATDISDEALKVAKENAKTLEADMTFYQGDMLQPLIEEGLKFDVLVCNPPYIKNTEHMGQSVIEYEPHLALFGGEDGLYFYRKFLENAKNVINDKGLIAFEIGFDIGEAVVELSKTFFPKAEVILKQDINQLDRMVFIRI